MGVGARKPVMLTVSPRCIEADVNRRFKVDTQSHREDQRTGIPPCWISSLANKMGAGKHAPQPKENESRSLMMSAELQTPRNRRSISHRGVIAYRTIHYLTSI
jgi:hypothetical protein